MKLRRLASSLTLGTLLAGSGSALADVRARDEAQAVRATPHAPSVAGSWLHLLDFLFLGDGALPDPPKDEPEPEPTEGPQTDPNG
jgi:hypothetical protein